MSISNLPSDLVKEIISKIPLKYVKAVRLTCKEWNTIIKNRSLTKMAIGEAAKDGEYHMIAMMNNNLSLMKISVNGDPSAETKGKLICLNNTDDQIKIVLVFHCQGLLLCTLKDDTRLVVWNPYWGQTRWIVPRFYHSPHGYDRCNYALGYENKKSKSCRSFKLFRFIDYYYKFMPENNLFWYEIYDLDSGLWKTLDITPHWKINYLDKGVSLKGNTYWIAGTRDSCDETFDHIICFDFTSERFGPLLRLPFTAGLRVNIVTLSCVREEKLAVLFFHNEPWEIEIWMSTKIQTKNVWWSKFLYLDVTNSPWNYPEVGTFIIDEVKKAAMILEEWQGRYKFIIIGEAGYVREIDLGAQINPRRSWPWVCPYVPSLVQIKQVPARCKRKRKSSLESRLYKRNMVKLVALEKSFYKWRYGS